jgi:hypothetical protein
LLLELFCESSPDFTDEEDFELPLEDFPLSVTELEDWLTEDEESPIGSGETEEEESSPHATSIVRRTDKTRTLLKIFTEDLQLYNPTKKLLTQSKNSKKFPK